MSQGKVLTFVNREVNMKLARIARDVWDVLAVLDARDHCQVLDFIAELGANYDAAKRALIRVLRVELPLNGPLIHNVDQCKPLGGGIFEIRRQPKGQKLRVLFFYDDGSGSSAPTPSRRRRGHRGPSSSWRES